MRIASSHPRCKKERGGGWRTAVAGWGTRRAGCRVAGWEREEGACISSSQHTHTGRQFNFHSQPCLPASSIMKKD